MQVNMVKQARRRRRKLGIRKGIFGDSAKPRLSVYRSLTNIYAQIIDDTTGKTLVAASSVQEHLEKGGNKASAVQVGTTLAQRAKEAGITTVAFDRNGFRYHGRLKALADAAREGGLKF